MNKLAQTIATFSKAETRQFERFLQSPYFNQREDVVVLFHWLLEFPKSPPGEPTFARVYPGEPFDASKLRLTMSYLQKQAELFLACQRWRNHPASVATGVVQELRHRGLENHFKDALRQAKQTLEQQPVRNSDYHMGIGQVLWEEARFESQRNPTEIKYLAQLSDHADLWWVLQKLRYLCLNRMQLIMYKMEEHLPLRAEVESIVHQQDMLQHNAVAAWFYCLKMLEEPTSAAHFEQFKGAFLGHNQLFHHDETRDLYLFALNYCIRRVNAGERQFFHDIMGFYKDGLQKEYILDNGILSRSTYHNIVAAGLQTQEYEWVEQFIHRYQNFLERTYRDSSFSFNKARLEFARKNYGEALLLLQRSHYYDPLLNLAAKTMSLKIYYELGEYELLKAHLDALKNYIRRKVTIGYHRTNYLNLIKYTLKLIGLNRQNQKEVATLRQKVQNEVVLTERNWILAQLD
jgi:tetratricopeptide (TPR) repeat protein